MSAADIFTFPEEVNEVAARVVAGGVLAASVVALTLSATVSDGYLWVTAALAFGFVARVLAGPTFSPLAQLATRVVAPRLGGVRPVPGPPKRFAQGIGAVVTVTAVVLLALGDIGATQALLGLMVVAAGLESLAGYCIGCKLFAALMRVGVVSPAVCEACANVNVRA
jgi:hypothetical protein